MPRPDNVRTDDPAPSHDAGARARAFRTPLKVKILHEFSTRGPMTARQVEVLQDYTHYAPSTVRKRISELHQDGELQKVGTKDRMTLWSIPPMSGEQRSLLL